MRDEFCVLKLFKYQTLSRYMLAFMFYIYVKKTSSKEHMTKQQTGALRLVVPEISITVTYDS
jgi:YbbR domain-containing protein